MNTVLWDKNTVSVYAEVSDGSFVLPVPIRWLYHNRLKYNYTFYLTDEGKSVVINSYDLELEKLTLHGISDYVVTDEGGSMDGDGGGDEPSGGSEELYVIRGMISYDENTEEYSFETTVTYNDVKTAIQAGKIPIVLASFEDDPVVISLHIKEYDILSENAIEFVRQNISVNGDATYISVDYEPMTLYLTESGGWNFEYDYKGGSSTTTTIVYMYSGNGNPSIYPHQFEKLFEYNYYDLSAIYIDENNNNYYCTGITKTTNKITYKFDYVDSVNTTLIHRVFEIDDSDNVNSYVNRYALTPDIA